MSSSIDMSMATLSMEEIDEPFEMPDYFSSESNVMSIIGRILNPECLKMSSLILDMPRNWKIYDRVRGVALSQERFPFIFKYEHDMEEVLSKVVWTYNDWAIVIDRWREFPPEDYLQFMPIWVQIRNIPINYYTAKSIMALGELIGQVKVVAYDPRKAQNRDYVRVQVRFDVSRPLRRSKVVILPSGESTTVWYDFERIQKRCYECQRLTHERERCPLILKKQQE